MCLVPSTVFVFTQKSAYELRISDWSSDVCSSDLLDLGLAAVAGRDHLDADAHRTAAAFFEMRIDRDDVAQQDRRDEFHRLDRHRRGDRKSTRLNSSH